MPFAKPLARTREYISILREIWARKGPLEAPGPHYALPLPDGTGLGKPLKSSIHPLREDIPIYLGAEGPKNIALCAELCDGWLAMLFSPAVYDELYRPSLEEGFSRPGARRSAEDFEVCATVPLIVTDDLEAAADALRPFYALYFGGMGAKGANFHANVPIRMGYEKEVAEIQELYLGGKKEEAGAKIPHGADRRALADRPAREDPRRPRALARVGGDHAAHLRRHRHAARGRRARPRADRHHERRRRSASISRRSSRWRTSSTRSTAAASAGETPSLPLPAAELERRAQQALSAEAFGYVAGGAGAELTMRANLRSLRARGDRAAHAARRLGAGSEHLGAGHHHAGPGDARAGGRAVDHPSPGRARGRRARPPRSACPSSSAPPPRTRSRRLPARWVMPAAGTSSTGRRTAISRRASSRARPRPATARSC